ncbi:MAG: hypothetical protein MZV70_00945 [Desulfobacterales bacterium]|nr:hypothetical protein [Desulfobacterales bacterium]
MSSWTPTSTSAMSRKSPSEASTVIGAGPGGVRCRPESGSARSCRDGRRDL